MVNSSVTDADAKVAFYDTSCALTQVWPKIGAGVKSAPVNAPSPQASRHKHQLAQKKLMQS